MRKTILLSAVAMLLHVTFASSRVVQLSDYGLIPNTDKNLSAAFREAIGTIRSESKKNEKIVLQLTPGSYHFYPEGSTVREYYISNHDQDNPKNVAIALEDFNNLTLDGQGAELIFHGRMLPISLLRSKNTVIKNLSIDFVKPHITQVQVLKNDPQEGITFKVAPWASTRIDSKGYLEAYGEGWAIRPFMGIAFEEGTKHIVYRTSDISTPTHGVKEVAPQTYLAPEWKDARLIAGTVVALRAGERPTPGFFLSHNKNTTISNVKVHYCEGIGLLAQLCENITLDGFSVCLKGDTDPRYFTSQGDATQFSGCKGKIISINGLYEGMMDDAINIHGTYLKVIKRVDDKTLIGRYMHDQSWGFEWGRPGDKVQFINSKTMELFEGKNTITAIRPVDKPQIAGAREYEITFSKAVDPAISEAGSFGIENLEWTPEVLFAHNTIRNNRARGALFSTPKKTIVEDNLFDHISGSAILLCGDCNGWYETGACRNVIIRNNKFINGLTNMFQYTEAIISIYPVIPDLKSQKQYFHGGKEGGVTIEHNLFDSFDVPLVYAKSIDGVTFRNNTIRKNNAYKPFHNNNKRFFFHHVINVKIKDNDFEGGFDPSKEIREE